MHGYNGTITRPLGHMELLVAFGTFYEMRLIRIKFLLQNVSIYNSILERTFLETLGAVSSIVHLKIKFHTLKNQIALLEVHQSSCQTCFLALLRKQTDIKESRDLGEEYDETLDLNFLLEKIFLDEARKDDEVIPPKTQKKEERSELIYQNPYTRI